MAALQQNLARFTQAIVEDPEFDIQEVLDLITDTSDDDVHKSREPILALCHTITSALIDTKRPIVGINLLSIAILKLQTHPSELTQIHSDLCLLCLDAKCLHPAIKFLEINYTNVAETDDRPEDVKHVLLFYYYGGLIHAAMKNFERAAFFFEVVLTVPATHVSLTMQDALKKYILVTLMLNDKQTENILPKHASPCLIRQKRQICDHYLMLAREYFSLDYNKINQIINANSETFQNDDNMGLVKQCLIQVHKKGILKLTKIFLTTPLDEVAQHVGLASAEEAENYILQMIDDGELYATIDHKEQVVVFHENPERYDTVKVFHRLQEEMSVSTQLINTLRDFEAKVAFKTVPKMGEEMQ